MRTIIGCVVLVISHLSLSKHYTLTLLNSNPICHFFVVFQTYYNTYQSFRLGFEDIQHITYPYCITSEQNTRRQTTCKIRCFPSQKAIFMLLVRPTRTRAKGIMQQELCINGLVSVQIFKRHNSKNGLDGKLPLPIQNILRYFLI